MEENARLSQCNVVLEMEKHENEKKMVHHFKLTATYADYVEKLIRQNYRLSRKVKSLESTCKRLRKEKKKREKNRNI